jgi:hypothetical protein
VRISKRYLASAAVVGACAAVAVPALAASPPKHAKLVAKGGESFKPNAYTKDSQHWVPGTVVIRAGGTLTVSNKTTSGEPHTFSIVKKSDVPRTLNQVFNCAICNTIALSHGVNPNGPPPNGPPPITTVDVNNDGFNEPGDSQFVPPHGTVHVQITAKRGTTLYFICIIHPWMQGVVKVK